MTLVAAFRCFKNGILLCADREEDDGYNKREVDKIFRIQGLKACEIFIAGAGPTSVIAKTNFMLHEAFSDAENDGADILTDHRALLESKLRLIHKEYAANLKDWAMHLLIVIAPRGEPYIPVLYRTDKAMLVPEFDYAAYGTGKPIADYLADRLYSYVRLESRAMGILAAFIFREAQGSSSGVGLGADMVFIHESGKSLYSIPSAKVKELENCVPPLGECIDSCWRTKVVVPEWFVEWN